MSDVEQPRMMYGPIIDGWAALGSGDEAAKWLSQAEAEGLGKQRKIHRRKCTHSKGFGDAKTHSKKKLEQMWSKCGRLNMAGIELNMILYNALSSANCAWCDQKPCLFPCTFVKEGMMFLKHTPAH